MAENTIKIRAKKTDGVTHVKALIKHAMRSSTASSSTNGNAHFIQQVDCQHNDQTVFKANWGSFISKNPYLSFKFEGGNSGDSITISWIDNLGDSDSLSATIG